MSIKSEIIDNIAFSISEVLKALQKHDPGMCASLVNEPYSGAIEEKLSNILYNRYKKDRTMERYFNDIMTLDLKDDFITTIEKKHVKFADALKRARKISKKYSDDVDVSIMKQNGKKSWVWVQPENQRKFKIGRRMYLNVSPGYVDIVVYRLLDFMMHGWHAGEIPAFAFKFPYYKLASKIDGLIRADKIIVYYANDPKVHEHMRDLAGEIGMKFLKKGQPLYTINERDGVAFALEPTPTQQGYAKLHTGAIESYGGFISLVIARYLYAVTQNYGRLPSAGEIKQIAEDIYENKLEGKHGFKFI